MPYELETIRHRLAKQLGYIIRPRDYNKELRIMLVEKLIMIIQEIATKHQLLLNIECQLKSEALITLTNEFGNLRIFCIINGCEIQFFGADNIPRKFSICDNNCFDAIDMMLDSKRWN